MADEPEVPEVHRVILAAAVWAALGPGARILRIEPAVKPSGAWSRRGRGALHGSHNLRPLARPDAGGPR